MRTVSLLGSTGSIGTQAVDVLQAAPEKFRLVALAAWRSVDTLVAQANALRPALVVIGDESLVPAVRAGVPAGTEVLVGIAGMVAAAEAADVVLNAVVGFAGLPVTMAALESGRRLALANKESLIAGAPVVQKARRTPGAEIVPVDSEHCAVHQCLAAVDGPESVSRLLLTASGGPFRGWSAAQLADVTVADALAHPTWSMGPKITIDSSTLMNKGLEVIEAHELFGVDYDRIDIVVHPQSIVHSMVELRDGSTLAQLSNPDMRLPIGYALGWPDRLPVAYGALDWTRGATLTFEAPDREVFRCIGLAYQAGAAGGSAPAWLSAANEVAVEAFLAGHLPWEAIADVVAATLDHWRDEPVEQVESVLEADAEARAVARAAVARRTGAPSAGVALPTV
jgi:1-deoxy-D-xylulose-5-phosphate reductoisomerase